MASPNSQCSGRNAGHVLTVGYLAPRSCALDIARLEPVVAGNRVLSTRRSRRSALKPTIPRGVEDRCLGGFDRNLRLSSNERLQRWCACAHICRRRRAWVPDPPASPVTRDPPGGARTVLRLRPPTLDVAPARPCSSTKTHPLGPVLDAGLQRSHVPSRASSLREAPLPALDCTASPCSSSVYGGSIDGRRLALAS